MMIEIDIDIERVMTIQEEETEKLDLNPLMNVIIVEVWDIGLMNVICLEILSK